MHLNKSTFDKQVLFKTSQTSLVEQFLIFIILFQYYAGTITMQMKFSQLNLPIVLIISLYDLRIYYKEPRIKVPRSNDQSVNDLLTNVIFIHGK